MTDASAETPGSAALAARYRAVVLDLDGVVYLGEQVIPGAAEALADVRELGVAVGFVTNNSYRRPEQVAEKLLALGVKAAAEEVFTSAQATVRLLGGALDGAKVLVIGGAGLRTALEAAGAGLLDPADWREADLVAVGIDPALTYGQLAAACLAIRAGAAFVGSNPDSTMPTPDGQVPGNGSVLALLETATGVRPRVAGKPEPALFETAAAALGSGPLLMVGDRSDTDLEGAARLGWDTALVLTGATTPAGLLDLPAAPDHLLTGLNGLLDQPGAPVRPAGRDDADAVASLFHQVGLAGRPSPERLRSTLVATGAGEVVGAITWTRQGEQALLRALAVAPAWRGRLLGSRLVLQAGLRLRAAGVRRLGVRAPAGADRFFDRLGFSGATGGVPGPPPPGSGPTIALGRELRTPSAPGQP
ncbi:MAG TPA: HAD-IIA family hydrolase [Actinomycetota bacterium]|nr:HAD-IIA family hydrolase [Actinomycetota bacterium]